MSNFRERLLGAARLSTATYEEVEHDPSALNQAFAVVLLYGAAAGIAGPGHLDAGAVLARMIAALFGWAIWAVLTFVIGTRLLPEPQTSAGVGQLLRVLGFATVPGIGLVLAVIGPLRPVVFVVTQVWMITAMVVAVRQALDYTSTLRAVGVCVIGWVVQILVATAMFAAVGPAPASLTAEDGRPDRNRAAAGSVGVVRPSAVAPPVQ